MNTHSRILSASVLPLSKRAILGPRRHKQAHFVHYRTRHTDEIRVAATCVSGTETLTEKLVILRPAREVRIIRSACENGEQDN